FEPQVVEQNAADQFVGKLPAVRQARSGDGVVPREGLLLELAQVDRPIVAQLNELKVGLVKVIRQDRQQKILQKRAGERGLRVGFQKRRDLAGKQRLLKRRVPERVLVDELRLPGLHGRLRPHRDDQILAGPQAKNRQGLHDGCRLAPQPYERRIDVLEQF